MKTDKEIHELFTSDPSELYALLDLPYPEGGVEVRVEQFKQVEQTSDLTAVPNAPDIPAIIFEFQARRSVDLHGRGMLAAGLFLSRYFPNRRCEVHLVYFSRGQNPHLEERSRPCENFSPFVHYLDERMRELAAAAPEHPLVSVFFPVMETDPQKLEDGYLRHYAKLKRTPELPPEARGRWCEVFQLWLMRALGMDNLEEVRKMLLEDLPQVEDTVWGRELIAIHRKEGMMKALEDQLVMYQEKLRDGTISQDVYDILARETLQDLAALRDND